MSGVTLAVTPDGSRIAWGTGSAAPNGETPGFLSYLWTADMDGANRVALLDGVALGGAQEGPRLAQPVRFSQDQGILLFAALPQGLGGMWHSFSGRYDRLYSIPATGGEPELIFDCASEGLFLCIGDVLPDGSALAYVNSTEQLIKIIALDGSPLATLTPPLNGYVGYPTFNQAGDLAFSSAMLGGPADMPPLPAPGALSIARTPYTSGAETIITEEGIGSLAGWAGDTHLRYHYLSPTSSGTGVVPTDGGAWRTPEIFVGVLE
jgi:hypothetical protein